MFNLHNVYLATQYIYKPWHIDLLYEKWCKDGEYLKIWVVGCYVYK